MSDLWFDRIARRSVRGETSRRQLIDGALRASAGSPPEAPGIVLRTGRMTRRQSLAGFAAGALAAGPLRQLVGGGGGTARAAGCMVPDETCREAVVERYQLKMESLCKRGGKNAKVDSMRESAYNSLGCMVQAELVMRNDLANCERPSDAACGHCERCDAGSGTCLARCGPCDDCSAGGACVSRCQANEICQDGTCKEVCQTGESMCGDPPECTNIQTNSEHCGRCGNYCLGDEQCIDGICMCDPAQGEACGTDAVSGPMCCGGTMKSCCEYQHRDYGPQYICYDPATSKCCSSGGGRCELDDTCCASDTCCPPDLVCCCGEGSCGCYTAC